MLWIWGLSDPEWVGGSRERTLSGLVFTASYTFITYWGVV